MTLAQALKNRFDTGDRGKTADAERVFVDYTAQLIFAQFINYCAEECVHGRGQAQWDAELDGFNVADLLGLEDKYGWHPSFATPYLVGNLGENPIGDEYRKITAEFMEGQTPFTLGMQLMEAVRRLAPKRDTGNRGRDEMFVFEVLVIRYQKWIVEQLNKLLEASGFSDYECKIWKPEKRMFQAESEWRFRVYARWYI